MTPSPFHGWLHNLPPAHVQALRDFRRCARAAHDGPDYLSAALAADIEALLQPTASPRNPLTPREAAAIISAMPRAFVLSIHG